MVHKNEIAEYTAALSHFNSFYVEPCHFVPDPDLAAQFGITWNGTPWCYGTATSAVFAPSILSGDYFVGYGINKSYNKPVGTYPNFGQIVAGIASGESTALMAQKALGGIATYTQVLSLIANIITVESFVIHSLNTLAIVASYAGPACQGRLLTRNFRSFVAELRTGEVEFAAARFAAVAAFLEQNGLSIR